MATFFNVLLWMRSTSRESVVPELDGDHVGIWWQKGCLDVTEEVVSWGLKNDTDERLQCAVSVTCRCDVTKCGIADR